MANGEKVDYGVLFAGITRRVNADGTTTVYCRKCGRPIMRAVRPTILTVSKCQICILREQGVQDPEKHVLSSYLQYDPTQPPVSFDEGDPTAALYPDQALIEGKTPMVGGVMGTAKAMFRAIVGWFSEEEEMKVAPTPATKMTREKRKGKLYER